MSLCPMYRKCGRCRRVYSFNPSIGDPGLVCKYCGRPQLPSAYPTPPPFPGDRFPKWRKL